MPDHESLYQFLSLLHIVSGATALTASFGAVASRYRARWHDLHVRCGRVFFWGMAGVFVTALPMTYLHPNRFLLLVAIFSWYLAWSGWRAGRNRDGRPRPVDWCSAGIMVLAGLVMVGLGSIPADGELAPVLVVFGSIGVGMGGRDLLRFRSGGTRGTERIALHLTRMLAGTIAAVTAFTVTNITTSPQWIAWLAPTILIAPLITWWNFRIRSGRAGS